MTDRDKPPSSPELLHEVRREIRRELEADRGDGSGRGARPACVEAEDLWLAFGDHAVLKGVSFEVDRGETLCILGGSGVGKSTILRLLLRLISPDAGRIRIDGRDIVHISEDDVTRIRRRMGMVFQGSALFDSLTVFENVAFPLREHFDRSEPEVRERVHEVLRFVDLTPTAVQDLLPAELSGGMRKRVGIARAIVHEPDILLFDEPTSGLDPVTTRTIDDLILKLRREISVCGIVVTHDIRSATRIATRAALLMDGKVIFMGAPEDMLVADDAYVRAFLG